MLFDLEHVTKVLIIKFVMILKQGVSSWMSGGVWEQDNGKVSLQQRLLFDIYKTTKFKIDTVESGKMKLFWLQL